MRRGLAFVRRPSPRLADGELTFLQRQLVDPERADAQHAQYRSLLERLGLRVVVLPDAPELPDAAFVEDTAVVFDGYTVLTRPGAASRRAEVETVREPLRAEGFELTELVAPATLDGGDVLQVGDAVYVGRSTRTNEDGVAQLRAAASERGRRVVAVDVPGALHLKTAAGALPDGSLMAVSTWVDVDAFGLPWVEAPEPAGANVLTVGATAVVSAAAPETAALLRRRGCSVETLDISEFEKVEAGLTCLSVLA